MEATVTAKVLGSPWNAASETMPERLHVVAGPSLRELNLEMAPGSQAAIEIGDSSPHLKITVKGTGRRLNRLVLTVTSLGRLEVRDSRVDIGGNDNQPSLGNVEDVLLEDAQLDAKRCKMVRLRAIGQSGIDLARVRLGELAVGRGAKLDIKTGDAKIERLKPIHDSDAAYDFVLNPGSVLRVEQCDNASVAVGSSSTLEITKTCTQMRLTGSGEVVLAGLAQDITFGGSLELSVRPHSNVVGASGQVILDDVRDSTITAADGSKKDVNALCIMGVVNAESLERLSVSGVTFPVSSEGLKVISALAAHALHVTPAVTSQLPGHRRSHRRPFAAQTSDTRDLRLAAIYTSELAALATQKATSGGSRTKLRWCAYRMRNLTADGAWERFVLSLYRLIGYGERPGPPLAAFLLAALLSTAIAHQIGDSTYKDPGLLYFVRDWVGWMNVPVHVVDSSAKTAYAGDLWHPLETALRLLVAVPFVTSVLALRKFVKA